MVSTNFFWDEFLRNKYAIMEILIFFTLFIVVRSKSNLDSRQRFELNYDETMQVIGKLSPIKAFHEELEKTMSTLYWIPEIKNERTVASETLDVYNAIEMLKTNLRKTVVKHVKEYFRIYYALATIIINGVDEKQNNFDYLISIRFDHYNLCVLSFMFNIGENIDPIFHSVFFLQTFLHDVSETFDIEASKQKLENYENTYYSINDDINYHNTQMKNSWVTDDNKSRNAKKTLIQMKSKIITFSDKCCLPSIPLLVNRSLLYGKDNGYFNTDDFIQHIFQNEKCTLYIYVYVDSLRKNEKEIGYWNCTGILDDPEYGIDAYLSEIKLTTEDKFRRNQSEELTSWFKKERTKMADKLSSAMSWIIHSRPYVIEILTLMQIRKNLMLKSYLNGVLYYNIASEIMILASIKEGLKLIKGIKKIFEILCADEYNTNVINYNAIKFMRTNLFTFSHILEKLSDRIWYELHIIVPDWLKTGEFYNLLHKTLEILKIKEDVNDKKILPQICLDIKETLTSVDVAYFSDKSEYNMYFDEYYFIKPILNIINLYNFKMPYFN